MAQQGRGPAKSPSDPVGAKRKPLRPIYAPGVLRFGQLAFCRSPNGGAAEPQFLAPAVVASKPRVAHHRYVHLRRSPRACREAFSERFRRTDELPLVSARAGGNIPPWGKNILDCQVHFYPPSDKTRRKGTDSHSFECDARTTHRTPPTLLITAECDVLRDEGEAYAGRLMGAGVLVTATRYLDHPLILHAESAVLHACGTPGNRAGWSRFTKRTKT